MKPCTFRAAIWVGRLFWPHPPPSHAWNGDLAGIFASSPVRWAVPVMFIKGTVELNLQGCYNWKVFESELTIFRLHFWYRSEWMGFEFKLMAVKLYQSTTANAVILKYPQIEAT